jgi:hypothetical protein
MITIVVYIPLTSGVRNMNSYMIQPKEYSASNMECPCEMYLSRRATYHHRKCATGNDPLLGHDVPHAHVLPTEVDGNACGAASADEGPVEPAQYARRLPDAGGEAEVQLRHLVSVRAARVGDGVRGRKDVVEQISRSSGACLSQGGYGWGRRARRRSVC